MKASHYEPRGAPPGRYSARGFTLLEAALSLGIVTLLMGSLGSVVVLTARAMPMGATHASGLAAASAADQLSQDLRFATEVLEAEPDRVVFMIPDRNGSGVDEMVMWRWGGRGEPLERTYNNGSPVVMLESVHDFDLQYKRRQESESKVVSAIVDSGEVLLCSFTGWSGVNHNLASANITGTSWASEKFVVDRITFPPETTSWRITRVSVRLRSGSALGSGVTVGIHRPTQLLGFIPMLTPVGTPGLIPSSVLTSSSRWQDATFNDVVFTDLNEKHLIFVVKPALATNIAYLEYYTATNAPNDAYVYQSTIDAGLTWSPTNNQHRNDAPFFVYGSYQHVGTEVISEERFTLGQVTVTIQPQSDLRTRLTSGIQLANQPETPPP